VPQGLGRFILAGLLTGVTVVAVLGARGGNRDLFNESLVRSFTYRNVGPFRMQARASAIAVPASTDRDHRYTFYLATWTGGIFKTNNGVVTFKPVFDGQKRLTIGAIAVAPSNSAIIWAGTGETRGARSSYRGDGIYKSVDAGETWTNMGLPDSHHIARASSTSASWVICIRRTTSGVCSRRRTAARRGNASSS
jgi:hypothetical protein